MQQEFITMLNEPKNTLGRTVEVVEMINKKPTLITDLFELYFQDDEWVRLRVSSVLKRLWRQDSSSITPFLDRWVTEVAVINQPSVNWTFAQMVEECDKLLSSQQRKTAVEHIQSYLTTSNDWIVLNTSIQVLGTFAKTDDTLKSWLAPHLKDLQNNEKKSVASRAKKTLTALSE